MRLTVYVLVAALLAGCKQQPQRAEQTPNVFPRPNVSLETLRKDEPGYTDLCLRGFLANDASPISDEKCFKFGKRQRMSGTWAAAFEGSQFCSGDASSCDLKTANPDTWLAFTDPAMANFKKYRGGVYAIDFIGRRTLYPGHYGHMGMFSQEVLVDRIVSLKVLKAPPKD